MLDDTLLSQLKAYLERVSQPFTLVASLDDSENAAQMRTLLEQIASLSDKISVRFDGTDARRPSFALERVSGPAQHLRFALDGDYRFEVYMSLSCHNCPDVVQALSLMAVLNPRVQTVVIDGGLYQGEVESRQIMAVPTVYLNGELFGSGRMDVAEIVAKLDTGSAQRDAAKLNAKAPYDVLIVGGGPAGAAAAVYAARKGIRVGVAAERFGGQVNDTLAIENYISVLETDGPKFGMALEAHVRQYGVEILNQQRAEKLIPAEQEGGLIGVQFAHGGRLQARSVILSTGARWRNVNVPGEAEYRNKGVAYCPHCDGPLFK
ncbi:MAG: alkyl hydroperoxide reductase subunit F, partial [Thiomonas sp. 15-63-373]